MMLSSDACMAQGWIIAVTRSFGQSPKEMRTQTHMIIMGQKPGQIPRHIV